MRVYRDLETDEHGFHTWRSYQLVDVERKGMIPDLDTEPSEQFHESLYCLIDLEGELWECPDCGRLHFRRPGEKEFHPFRPDA